MRAQLDRGDQLGLAPFTGLQMNAKRFCAVRFELAVGKGYEIGTRAHGIKASSRDVAVGASRRAAGRDLEHRSIPLREHAGRSTQLRDMSSCTSVDHRPLLCITTIEPISSRNPPQIRQVPFRRSLRKAELPGNAAQKVRGRSYFMASGIRSRLPL